MHLGDLRQRFNALQQCKEFRPVLLQVGAPEPLVPYST